MVLQSRRDYEFVQSLLNTLLRLHATAIARSARCAPHGWVSVSHRQIYETALRCYSQAQGARCGAVAPAGRVVAAAAGALPPHVLAAVVPERDRLIYSTRSWSVLGKRGVVLWEGNRIHQIKHVQFHIRLALCTQNYTRCSFLACSSRCFSSRPRRFSSPPSAMGCHRSGPCSMSTLLFPLSAAVQ